MGVILKPANFLDHNLGNCSWLLGPVQQGFDEMSVTITVDRTYLFFFLLLSLLTKRYYQIVLLGCSQELGNTVLQPKCQQNSVTFPTAINDYLLLLSVQVKFGESTFTPSMLIPQIRFIRNTVALQKPITLYNLHFYS